MPLLAPGDDQAVAVAPALALDHAHLDLAATVGDEQAFADAYPDIADVVDLETVRLFQERARAGVLTISGPGGSVNREAATTALLRSSTDRLAPYRAELNV